MLWKGRRGFHALMHTQGDLTHAWSRDGLSWCARLLARVTSSLLRRSDSLTSVARCARDYSSEIMGPAPGAGGPNERPRVLLDDNGDLQALFVGQTPTAGSDASRTAAYTSVRGPGLKHDDRPAALNVLNDTDFPSNCAARPYAHGSSAEGCAAQCVKRSDCVAAIYCATCSAPGDSRAGACAFKCRSDNPVHKKGIQAVVVRPSKATCPAPAPAPAPPPPPPFSPPDGAKDPDWLERYQAANLLYADADLDGALFPYIGNGYVATHPVAGRSPGTIASAAETMSTMFVSGVFNGIAVQSPCEDGYCAAPHRAKVPTYRVVLNGTMLSGRYALDIERAMLLRRVTLDGLEIEERWYAHLVHRELLVHEITLNNTAGTAARSVSVDAVAGGQDPSFPFTVSNTKQLHTILGAANHSERPELNRTQVAVSSNAVAAGQKLHVAAGQSKDFHFISAVATSLDSLDPQAKAEAKVQAALKDPSSLRGSHEAAWLRRWDQGRLEVGGNLGLAQAINSSLYFMLSSVRADWPMGMSPGGLASDGYDGHTLCVPPTCSTRSRLGRPRHHRPRPPARLCPHRLLHSVPIPLC